MKKYIIFIILFIIVSSLEDTKYNKFSINHLSLEEKIGQMLFVEYRSEDYPLDFQEAMEKYKPGGFIIYSENLWDHDNFSELIFYLQSISRIPMFIGIDQEGGYVQRVRTFYNMEFTTLKSFEKLGQESLEDTYRTGKIAGKELQMLGINVNFSPVLDLTKVTDDKITVSRSFSDNKNIVATYGKEYIQGQNSSNVISCAKHLPGIGSSTLDTHRGRSYIYGTKEELENNELVPFKESSKYLDMMMVSHDVIPSITGEKPLTLSKDGIDYLRDYLNYDGLIVSDGLKMKALTDYYSTKEILINAINAGVDVLLAPEKMSITVEFIKKAVLAGEINEARIDEAVSRILKVKSKIRKQYFNINNFYINHSRMELKPTDHKVLITFNNF